MYKVDLHTHSVASSDGGISLYQYQYILEEQILDVLAITDHGTTDFALNAQQVLGSSRVIAGQEIMTSAGEIIGLFLKATISDGLSPEATIDNIKAQNGLVYIPHPFETIRHGLHPEILESLVNSVDIIEVCNGRAFLQNRGQQSVVWARLNHKPGAAGSDAHSLKGVGRTYNNLSDKPNQSNLAELLRRGTIITKRPLASALLAPKFNRIKKKII